MTLPYKLALALACLTLAAAVVVRFTGGPGTEDASDVEAVAQKTLYDTARSKPPPVVVESEPERTVAVASSESAEGHVDSPIDSRVNNPDLADSLNDLNEQSATDTDADPAPGPPTLTVGRDPHAVPAAGTAFASTGLDGPEEDEADGTTLGSIDSTATFTVYTVRSGDTFEGIAKRQLGRSSRWVDLAQANPLVDPMKLRVGQTLRLPLPAPDEATESDTATAIAALDETETDETPTAAGIADAASALTTPAAPQLPELPEPVTHTVRTGDSLSTIAARYYGDSTRWRAIFDANRDVLDDPHAVRAGVTLTIPPAVSATERSASR